MHEVGFKDRLRIAIDSTGLEERHASRHYLGRVKDKKCKQRYWTKLSVACDTDTHLILSARTGRGPSNECVLWKPLLKAAVRHFPVDTALADAGFDSEDNHALARRKLNVRLTIIALNPRTHGRKWPQTKYRRQMRRRFLKGVYHQRSHVESLFSQHKRILLSQLRARLQRTRRSEVLLRVLVHNILLLSFFLRYLCNRAPLRERAERA